MRRFLFALLASTLFLAGCEDLSDTMRARMTTAAPKTQVFDGNAKQLLAASTEAFKRLDLHVIKAHPDGMQAASRIHTSETFGDSRQLVVDVGFSESEPGRTAVSVALTEQVQSPSMGGTSQQQLRENSFFATYFAMLHQVLQEQGIEKPGEQK